MKPAAIFGAVLIVIAIIGFAMGGFSFTHEKRLSMPDSDRHLLQWRGVIPRHSPCVPNSLNNQGKRRL